AEALQFLAPHIAEIKAQMEGDASDDDEDSDSAIDGGNDVVDDGTDDDDDATREHSLEDEPPFKDGRDLAAKAREIFDGVDVVGLFTLAGDAP
ncbi:hypothetical protein CYMTET_34896, partial [Cymbomonas tetramitiformis]